jgi:hypothetical protein
MIKGIIFIIGIAVIAFLYLVHSAMIKPIYNKIHNVWESDKEGKNIADFTLIIMLVIAFILGAIMY